MKALSIRALKNNPSATLRTARADDPVVVNRQQPQALPAALARLGSANLSVARFQPAERQAYEACAALPA